MTPQSTTSQNTLGLRAVLIGITVLAFAAIAIYAVYHSTHPDQTSSAAKILCEPFGEIEGRLALPLGTRVPDFTLESLDGEQIRLKTLLGEKPILLEIFATWCPHCQASVPGMKQIQKAFEGDLTLLAVNAGDKPQESSTGRAFQQHYEITYPVLDRPSKTLMDQYCLTGYPAFYLINPDGRVVWRHLGTLEGDALDRLKSTLEGHPVPEPAEKPATVGKSG